MSAKVGPAASRRAADDPDFSEEDITSDTDSVTLMFHNPQRKRVASEAVKLSFFLGSSVSSLRAAAPAGAGRCGSKRWEKDKI